MKRTARAWFAGQSFHWGFASCPRCSRPLPVDEHCTCQLAANEAANQSLGDGGTPHDAGGRTGPSQGAPLAGVGDAYKSRDAVSSPEYPVLDAWYDTPWGRRRCCPFEHEQSIGGDGYGDRCAGRADVMVVAESDPECPRHFCDTHCQERCCGACHAADVLEGEEACGGCLSDMEMERRANAEMDERDRRATTLDDRTPADHELERQQRRRDDDPERS